MNRDLSNIRKDFKKSSLEIDSFKDHPVIHFKQWLDEAIDAQVPEPTAMTLSTVSPQGRPSGRIVLLKHVCENEGFWFFTNYQSKKGRHLIANSFASLSFFWPSLERQIRIEGKVHKLTAQQSDKYFLSRPIDSQLSALVSPQSEVIANRELLMRWFHEAKISTTSINRPENWGGYSLIPDEIEFWQGRSGRLHDRIRFTLRNESWHKDRLAP